MPLFHPAPVLAAVEVCLYLLPSFIAITRRAPHLGTIIMVNTLLGWTIVGWFYSMAWAAFSERSGQALGDLRLSHASAFQAPVLKAANDTTE